MPFYLLFYTIATITKSQSRARVLMTIFLPFSDWFTFVLLFIFAFSFKISFYYSNLTSSSSSPSSPSSSCITTPSNTGFKILILLLSSSILPFLSSFFLRMMVYSIPEKIENNFPPSLRLSLTGSLSLLVSYCLAVIVSMLI